jgi:hypothetical protein
MALQPLWALAAIHQLDITEVSQHQIAHQMTHLQEWWTVIQVLARYSQVSLVQIEVFKLLTLDSSTLTKLALWSYSM